MRVRAEDVDTLRNDDKIDNFSCYIYGTDPLAASETESQWSTELACDGHDRKSTKYVINCARKFFLFSSGALLAQC